MPSGGYIKLFRSMTAWEWYKDSMTKTVFLHLLLTVNHAPNSWRGMIITPGQMVTSIRKLATELGISERHTRTALEHLKSTQEVTIQSTHSYSLITIANWAFYQADDGISTQQTTHRATSKRHSIDTPSDNKQEVKNEKKEKNSCSALDFSFIVDKKLHDSFIEYAEYRITIKKPLSQLAAKKAYSTLQRLSNNVEDQIAIIDQSIASGWQGLFELKSGSFAKQVPKNNNIGNFTQRQYSQEFLNSFYEDVKVTAEPDKE